MGWGVVRKSKGNSKKGGEEMWRSLKWVRESEGFYLVVVEFTNKQKLDRSLK